jgi:MOSC domain-containing protein YiiM
MNEYPVTIYHIFISPGHNYFGRPKDGPGDHATVDVAEVEAVAGLGLVGDRYFGVAAHYDAQVTFVSWEVFRALRAEFGREDRSPILMRRNIVIEGVPLNQLMGQPFTLDFGEHQVEYLGAKHCAPCARQRAVAHTGST